MASVGHRSFVLAVIAAALAWPGQAVAGLNTDSPFLPPSSAQSVGPGANATLEFRGIFEMDGVDYFNIADLTTKKSAWVRLNQPGAPFIVKAHEVTANGDMISVEQGGGLIRLAMIRPKIGNAPLVTMPQMGPRGPVFPVILNPTAADEARRMEAFAAEVRRRRLLRQQQAAEQRAARQPGVQGVPPPQAR